jgi:hypothetical protein
LSTEPETEPVKEPESEKPTTSATTIPAHLRPTPATINPSNPPPSAPEAKPLQVATPQNMARGTPTFGSGKPVPAANLDSMGRPKVDKYFGSRLPPVCSQLGCYVTDDGKFFYCINPHCHKDRKRETKYNRKRKSLVYFFCPKCKSREIQLHLRKNHYECLECAYTWKN